MRERVAEGGWGILYKHRYGCADKRSLIFSLSGTGEFLCKNKNWEGIQIYLSGKGFMSVRKGGGKLH